MTRSSIILQEAEQSLVDCFARSVAAYPEHVALLSDKLTLSYAELDVVSNRLARRLLDVDASRGGRVAILMQHDAAMIVAVLAALKAGKIVVVLNGSYPAARLRLLGEHAQPSILVSDATNLALAREAKPNDCRIIQVEEGWVQGPAAGLDVTVDAGDPAFLAFTSGTTGRPKALMLPHRMIRRCAIVYYDVMHFQPGDRITLLASPSGAQAIHTIWCAFAHGATLCPYAVLDSGFTHLPAWIARNGITIYISSASICRDLLRASATQRFETVRAVRLASEGITHRDVDNCRRHFQPDCQFLHSLASSEAGVIAINGFALRHEVAPGPLPVGLVQRGMDLELLDPEGRPAAQGEIVLSGRYLASGYWRDETLTAERFRVVAGAERRFFSGDIGRINGDGMLEVVGRMDDQVKIRGNRIELSEVRDALRAIDGVEAAAICTDQVESPRQLLAYLVQSESSELSGGIVRDKLRGSLPEHMIPSRFTFLPVLPLTSHGKIDYAALRDMTPARAAAPGPRSDTERLLCDIFGEAFAIEDVSPEEDFFDLGGDSLHAAVIAAKIHAVFKIELNLRDFIAKPTIGALALAIDDLAQTAQQDVEPGSSGGAADTPLSLFQERIWRFARTLPSAAGYTQAKRYELFGPLDVRILQDCLSYLSGRHDILRASFHEQDGAAVQRVHPPMTVELPVFDLTGAVDPEERAEQIYRREASRIFDLASPLVHFSLIRMGETAHQLICVSHHIIADGQSWRLFMDELAVLYRAGIKGETPPIPPRAELQYSEFAVWQRAVVETGNHALEELLDTQRRAFERSGSAELPFRRTAPATAVNFINGVQRGRLDQNVSRRLATIAGRERATLFQLRLAALGALLAAETGAADHNVGTYLSHRNTLGRRRIVGDFADLAILPLACTDLSQSFSDWLRSVRDTVADTLAQGSTPHQRLYDLLRQRGFDVPEVRIILSVGTPLDTYRCGELTIKAVERLRETRQWGFTLYCAESDGEHRIEAVFDPTLHEPDRVRGFLDRYVDLLRAIAASPDRSLTELLQTAGVAPRPVVRLPPPAPPPPPVPARVSRRAVAAIAIGNAIEWFDILIYGFLAVTLADVFFPTADPTISLLLALGSFGAAYLVRPFGAVVLGAFADRRGRKAGLTLSIGLMCCGTLALVLVPPYAAIGVAAPVIVTLARLVQGFAVGGEFGSATALLAEQRPDRRGFLASWVTSGQGLAGAMASACGLLLATLLDPAQLAQWGWRAAFAFGLILAPIGWYIRSRLIESPEFASVAKSDSPVREAVSRHGEGILVGLASVVVNTNANYVLLYIPTYAMKELHLSQSIGFSATLAGGLLVAFGAPVAGWLSDRVGRIPLMAVTAGLFLCSAVACFSFVSLKPSFGSIMTIVIWLNLVKAFYSGPLPGFMADLFPTQVRSSGISIAYNLAVPIFGGLTPVLVAWLIWVTGSVLAPGYYLMLSAFISLIALYWARRRFKIT